MAPQRTASKSNDVQAQAKPRRRWGRRILVFLLLIGIVIFFLPSIILMTPLKQKAIDWALADLSGRVQIDTISAGWFSPIQLHGIKLTDPAGQTIASVDKVIVSKTLLNLTTATDYGTVEIVRPTLDLQIRGDGSNVEDVVARYLQSMAKNDGTKPGSGTNPTGSWLPRVSVNVTDGLVQLRFVGDSETWLLESINATADLMSDAAPLSAKIECQARSETQPSGQLALSVIVDAGEKDLTVRQIQSSLETIQFPVAALAPVLQRFMGPMRCSGQLDGQLALAADTARAALALDVRQLNLRNFVVAAPDLLGHDQFAARNLTGQGKLNLSADELTAEKFSAETEFARINTDGRFNIQQISSMVKSGEIPNSNFQLDGVLDLAQIIQMLPETLGIRDGVEIKSGLVQIQASTRNENGTQRMVFNLDTANIHASRDGQVIIWQQPLRIVGAATQNNGQLLLENLECDSEFLKLNGHANLESGSFRAAGDLAKLTQQLGQLIDLGQVELAGSLNGQFNWQMAAAQPGTSSLSPTNRPIQIGGNFIVDKPVIQFPGMNRWSEDRLDLTVQARANATDAGEVGIETGQLQLKFGNELAIATLAGRRSNIFTNDRWQLACRVSGGVGKWLAQARNFVEMPAMDADGNLGSEFLLTLDSKLARINQLKFEATDFDFDGFAMAIREPKVTGTGNLTYDLQTGEIYVINGSVSSPTLAAGGEQIRVNIGKSILVDGNVAFRANANRASRWYGYSLPGDSVQWNGTAEGTMAFTSAQNAFGGELTTTIKDLIFYQRDTPVVGLSQQNQSATQQVASGKSFSELWREEVVELKTKVFVADDFNSVRLGGLQLNSKMAQVQGHGTIDDLGNQLIADLKGNWNVSWDEINKLVNSSAGDMVQFEGGGWQPFEIHGPLYPVSTDPNHPDSAWVDSRLTAKTSVKWNRANIMKMPLSSTTIQLNLAQAVARFSSDSKESLVGQVLQLGPALDLRSSAPRLTAGAGKLLDNWTISAEDSRGWLKYVAPLVADATSAQGQLSVTSDGIDVPLLDPLKMTARGEINIGQLAIGPGPLAQQILPMVDQLRMLINPGSSSLQDKSTWIRIKPQNVPYRVQDGRVYHEGMELNYKDIPIRTKGYVGFDQTISLIADLPILDAWLDDQPLLSGLKGQSIQIPITGTLTKPQLDRDAIRQSTQQLLRQSAQGAVSNVVNKEVEKLQGQATEKINNELNNVQNKLNDKLQQEVGNRLEGELRNGLNNLFKKK